MKFKNIYTQTKENVEMSLLSLWTPGRHLMREAIKELITREPLMAEPIFQSIFPWEQTSDNNWTTYLHPKVVQIQKDKAQEKGEIYCPFSHQVKSWEELKNGNSIVVTSGTGSGKTECFMLPVLSDLYSRSNAVPIPDTPVEAIFLYPLNALMQDQKERLGTDCQKLGLRFAVYNRSLEERRAYNPVNPNYPNSEVRTRENLRTYSSKETSCPQILLTNPSMLEFMLVRDSDKPIFDRSKGKLRWIVIDEAHSYTGSAAVELAYLIKRLLAAFGVSRDDVRIVCTSATIGDPKNSTQLVDFIETIIGKYSPNSGHRLVPIGGKRIVPTFDIALIQKALSIKNITDIKAQDILKLQKAVNERPLRLSEAWRVLTNKPYSAESALDLIDAICEIQIGKDFIMMLRGHFFMRAIDGIYTCVSGHDHNLTTYRGNGRCPICGAPLLEVVQCKDCKEFLIVCEENNNHEIKASCSDHATSFIDNEEGDADYDDDFTDGGIRYSDQNWQKLYLAYYGKERHYGKPHPDYKSSRLSLKWDGKMMKCNTGQNVGPWVLLENEDKNYCPTCACGSGTDGSRFSNFRLSSNWINGTIAPALLKEGASSQNEWGKYIAFTDSRQGTAIYAKRFNVDAERAYSRARLTSSLRIQAYDPTDDALIRRQMERNPGCSYDSAANYLINQNLISSPSLPEFSINRIADLIFNQQIFEHLDKEARNNSGIKYYQKDEIAYKTALIRSNIARRPVHLPNMESLGLITLTYPAINSITPLPRAWQAAGFCIDDYRAFLKICVDYVIRMGNHIQCPTPVEYQYLRDANNSTPYDSSTWPKVQKNGNVITPKQHRLILLLCAALGINDTTSLTTSQEQDINCLMNEAWSFLEHNLLKKVNVDDPYYEKDHQYEGHFYLDLSLNSSSCKVKAIEDAWLCPVTNYLIDTVFCGFSPSMKGCLCKENIDRFIVPAQPNIHIPLTNSQSFDSEKKSLIYKGVWNDRHKYAFLPTTQAYLTAEHSGQQNRELLDYYTNEFKSKPHKLNLLQCSTTMEMGVDIGDIETVLMTNIPPSSANYSQRTGRAGRRGQSKAVAFSLCPNTSIGMNTFENPMCILTSVNPAISPIVSDIIVQRHVNSFLVRSFLYSNAPLVHFWKVDEWLKPQGFYDSFMIWTARYRSDQLLEQEYHTIFGQNFKTLSSAIDSANHSLEDIANEYQGILADIVQTINSTKNKAKIDALTIQGNALMNLDLKGYLAEKQFLPNANMPTGVVEFNFMDSSQYKDILSLRNKIDQLKQLIADPGLNVITKNNKENEIKNAQYRINELNEKTVTSREIKVGLSEYAPGQMVVIDERNYVSAGIEWRNSLGQQQPWKYLYHCPRCGRFEYSVDPTLQQCKCGGTYEGILNPNGTNMTYAIEPIRFRTDVNRGKNRKEKTERTLYQIKTILTDVNWQSCIKGPMCDLVGSGSSPSSEIVFYNEGNGQGFNLCLDCGRMEVGGIKRTKENWPHKKIAEDTECPVNNNPYNNIVLSGKFPTSFVSLRFYKDYSGQSYVNDEELLYSIGVLLTRSLATEIGVSQDDIDFDVRGEAGYKSIFIFDTHKGGCGYSTRMTDTKTCNSVFTRAKEMISSFPCQCEDSISGACVHCLVDRYSQRFENKLSKFKVMEWFAGQSMKTSLSRGGATAVPIPLKYLLTSLYSNLNTTALTICVDAGEMNIDEWTRKDGTMGRILNECVRRGQTVRILIANIPTSNAQDMLPFVNISSRFQSWGITVEAIETGTNSQGETTALIVNNHDHYFTDEENVLPFSQDWGIRCSHLYEDNNIPSFSQTAFPTWADVCRLMLPNEITRSAIIKNPTTAVVGHFYSSVIVPNLLQQGDTQTILNILNGKKVNIVFSDSYVNSALAALLLVYLIKEMKDVYNFRISSVDLQFNGQKRRCDNCQWNDYTWITLNFPNNESADDYVEDLFQSVLGVQPNFSNIKPDHYRWLRLQPEGEDAYVEIRPDHGIGGGWISYERYKDLDYLDGTTQIKMKPDTDIVYYLLTKKK